MLRTTGGIASIVVLSIKGQWLRLTVVTHGKSNYDSGHGVALIQQNSSTVNFGDPLFESMNISLNKQGMAHLKQKKTCGLWYKTEWISLFLEKANKN